MKITYLRSIKFLGAASIIFLLSACASNQSISTAILAFEAQAGNVQLGQSKAEVLAMLSPTQASMPSRFGKPFEAYIEDDKLKEVYFFRSRSFADGLVTDDEFIPYVFEDGVLIAIGWTAIGGPKTQAQQRESDVHIYRRHRIFYY
ncbi:MAG: hypothetical protein QMC22_00815 [Pseudomonadales bacterium]